MSQKRESWLAWTLASIGLLGAGFAAGLHRIVWGLFWVVAVIWLLIIWWSGSKNHSADQWMYWLFAFGPPLIIGLVLRLVEGIVFTFFGGLAKLNDSQVSSSPNDGHVNK